MTQLDGAGRIRSGGFQKQAYIARLTVLRPRVAVDINDVWLGGSIAVIGGSTFKIGKRQVGLIPQPVADELAVIPVHRTWAAQ